MVPGSRTALILLTLACWDVFCSERTSPSPTRCPSVADGGSSGSAGEHLEVILEVIVWTNKEPSSTFTV